MKKLLLLTLALSFAGAGCASSTPAPYAVPAQPTPTPATAPAAVAPPVETVPLAAALGSNGMNVKNQAPAQDITISDVVAAKPGFIAVFSDEKGQPGPLAGSSSLLNAGETRDVPVQLRTATKDGETYWVTLFVDNGDKKFLPSSDTIAKNEKGSAATQSVKILK